MLGFETITLAPIDLNCIEPSLLTPDEKAWLNAYHLRVRDAVAPAFAADPSARSWLDRATRAI